MNKKYIVTLTEEERAQLQEMLNAGRRAARTLTQARVLLKADVSAGGPGWTDEAIKAALDVSPATIQRGRQCFVEQGLEAALRPRPQALAPLHLVDGAAEAHLVALACGAPPAGQARWSLRLLAAQMVELAYVAHVSHETVRQVLKKRPQALVPQGVVHPAAGQR